MPDSPTRPDPDAADLASADAEFLDAMGRLDIEASDASEERPAQALDPSRRTSGRHRRVRPAAPASPGAEGDTSSNKVRPGHALPRDPPPRTRRRRGKKKPPATVEARLDLHGAGVEEALDQLDEFLVQAHAVGCRRVLVITGRGRGSAGGEPVLRKAVLQWLRRVGRATVREIAQAPPELGGAGALVLLLRRDRR